MNEWMNRRDCLKALGLSGLATGLGSTPSAVRSVGASSGFQCAVIASRKVQSDRAHAPFVDGPDVRITRVLHGLETVTLGDLKAGTRFPDVGRTRRRARPDRLLVRDPPGGYDVRVVGMNRNSGKGLR